MIRPSTEAGRQILAVKVRAYADGTRDALESVVDGLRHHPHPAVREAAADLAVVAPQLLAQQRRVFAEQAGIEL